MSTVNPEIQRKAGIIKLLILDVDGVLTDGKICYSSDGTETKFFHVQDGLGIKLLQQAGIEVAIISSRQSEAVEKRMRELKIKHLHQGQEQKIIAYESLLKECHLTAEMTAYMGDDLPDIPVLEQVGLAIAVANAVHAVKKVSHWQTMARGGEGAVREACDMILASHCAMTKK